MVTRYRLAEIVRAVEEVAKEPFVPACRLRADVFIKEREGDEDRDTGRASEYALAVDAVDPGADVLVSPFEEAFSTRCRLGLPEADIDRQHAEAKKKAHTHSKRGWRTCKRHTTDLLIRVAVRREGVVDKDSEAELRHLLPRFGCPEKSG